MIEEFACVLCERDCPELTDHHLVPKSRGGKDTVAICEDCHKQIHALFDNKTIEENYTTVESLLLNEEFSKYLKWISTKPFGAVTKARRSRETKQRGRRG